MNTPISQEAECTEALHPMAQKVATAAARLKPLEDSTVEEARVLREERGNPFAPPACDLASIIDHEIPSRGGSIPVRLYKPLGNKKGLQPALIFYHGGGFVLGNVEQYDTFAQQIAFHSGCMVVSVDYRLAPDTKLTAIHEDGFDAYQWIRNNSAEWGIDQARLAVGGDSAGGNLTVAVLLACKRNQFPMPAFQILLYPSIDLAMSHASVEEFADGYFLTKAGMSWFRSHYLESEEQPRQPQFNYLTADLSDLPPAYVLTAGFDPLRDEGKAFADRLADFGVPVEHVCYCDMIHGFLSFAGGIPAGMEALEKIGIELRRALSANDN